MDNMLVRIIVAVLVVLGLGILIEILWGEKIHG